MSAGGAGAGQGAGAVAAVDLGATSGRVMIGRVGPNTLELEEAARFPNIPVRLWEGDRAALHWNVVELYRNVTEGLGAALRAEPGLVSVGVDAWAVDYGLLRNGVLGTIPYHYRDERALAGTDLVHARVGAADLYRQNGLQYLPFNSLYQLAVDRSAGRLDDADALLLIPDLFTYWLSGEQVAERTNASTTGLLTPDGGWNTGLIDALELPRSLFRPVVEPGTIVGPLAPSLRAELQVSGYGPRVTTVGSHDTASAVVAVPMHAETAAYISCGTWGLVGVELESPVLTDDARAANFTNEGGVDGRVRFLHNVMGLWLLSESIRTWQSQGLDVELVDLLDRAEAHADRVPVFDANDPRFLAPGDVPARIADWCAERGLAAPSNPVEYVRSIVESLADAFASAVRTAADLSGRSIDTVHIVGGGARNRLLCQLTADRSGLPVLAGPVEATAIGNVLVQARAQGLVDGDLESLRGLVIRAHHPLRYAPRPVRTH
ncbi:rhamnulokinase [Diaminobutyricibacter tongyongensis]|uniref:Rhamnulokinase n=1 Tax=Leifsonia tongyongensis TaxID=1268043 RepID=A0A6L9XWN3_9MICO|nr:rhamnulokinase family protein [Diaminobutyricibacter tongyongensis]NEN05607.1 rhamnulokinase [Diaminobutyricibacter tongyongensis]